MATQAPDFIQNTTIAPVIETNDLRKSYKMGDHELEVLKGVDVNLYKGEFVAIVGPSGSGKSTLMAILGALDKPTSGSYKLDGVEIGHMSEDSLSDVRNNRIGFVFQKFNLLARASSLNNVALPLVYSGKNAKERNERAQHMLELVGLGDRSHHRPNELSGGQQQRVAIARALVNNPSLILADEPTGNLDTRTGEEIMNLFKKLHSEQGITLVIVTHSPEIAEQAQRVIRVRDGMIVNE
jgi:putative ABC transport system ATP-binding protein